jgi:hypothetical protein
MTTPRCSPPPITLTSYHYAAVMHWLRGQLALYKGAAVKILWEVADRTFGHRKWEDVIALSQFAHACGIGRDTVLATLSDLLEVGILQRRPVGNSYSYWLVLPEDLFTAPAEDGLDAFTAVDNGSAVFHSQTESVSFFAQNSDTFPQNDRVEAEISSLQTKNVTENGNGEHRVSEIFSTLADLNATLPKAAYAIRHLQRWAGRAVMLGMHWGDVWTLWQACCRVGRRPVALFLHRLMQDGTLPTGKAPKVRDATKQCFVSMLE